MWYSVMAGFLFNTTMNDNEEYLNELSKSVDSKSILVINVSGNLSRIYCPFPVILVLEIDNLNVGEIYYVEAVKVAPSLDNVYVISGKAYLIRYFKISPERNSGKSP
jgi:hypothetical protein